MGSTYWNSIFLAFFKFIIFVNAGIRSGAKIFKKDEFKKVFGKQLLKKQSFLWFEIELVYKNILVWNKNQFQRRE